MNHFGDFIGTETAVMIPFNAFTSDDPSASVTLTNLANTDVHIHKDGSLTQRSSAAGIAVDIDVDGIVGCHWITIDLTDNTDAGFYSTGSMFSVRVEGITVDAATLNPWVGSFTIGKSQAAVTAALVAHNLDHLALTATAAADMTPEVADNTILSRLLSNGDTSAFVPSTDGLQPIRDEIAAGVTLGADAIGAANIADDAFAAEHFAADALVAATFATNSIAADALAADAAVQIAAAVWDRVLTGATHNIATSAGRRLRQVEAITVLSSGVAQDGAAGTITLAAGESATTDFYDHAIIVITAGTGIGQARAVNGYNGGTKVATVVPNWAVTPVTGDEYLILADTEKHVYEVHAGGITASSLAADAITAAKIADDAIAAEHLATGALTADAFAADAIVAATLATDAITSDALAASAATKITNDWETQSQADPTGFHVNVLEVGGTAQTAGDLAEAVITNAAGTDIAADIIAIKAETATIVNDTDLIDDATSGLAKIASDVAAVLVDTGTTLQAEVDAIQAAVITNAAGTDIAADIIALKVVADAIQTITDQLTSAQSEPTGVPAANDNPLVKLARLHMALRNRVDITASKKTFYDDGDSAEWEKDLSDDGTTYTESEGNAP